MITGTVANALDGAQENTDGQRYCLASSGSECVAWTSITPTGSEGRHGTERALNCILTDQYLQCVVHVPCSRAVSTELSHLPRRTIAIPMSVCDIQMS